MGHEVTVFAAAGSKPVGRLVETLPGPYGTDGSPGDWQLCEWINLCSAVELSERFDVLHSHAYLWGLPLQPISRAPMVHTLHVTPYEDQALLRSLFPDALVTAISHYQWSNFPSLKTVSTIYHGVDETSFTFRPEPEDYLCYLGRFTPEKGPLSAIAVARSVNSRLLLAGPRNEYFRERIEPLVDGTTVEYVGYVSGQDKDRLLGGARALLYPVEAPEPFGLVMIEAMMCGTPVVAVARGAVTEIIDEGLTGYYGEDLNGLVALTPQVFQLDRARVRQRAEQRFSAKRMATEYAQLYARLIGHGL